MTRIFVSLGAVALLLGCIGCGGSNPPPAIFLGHVATLTGPNAKPGKAAERGIRLALDELGSVASEKFAGRPIVVRHVDAAGSLDNLEAQATRLVSVNRVVALLGGVSKDEALRLARNRVPVLSPAGFRAGAEGVLLDLLFTTGLAPSTQADVLAQYLVEEASPAGALIVDARREESGAFAEHFRRAWMEAWQKKDPKAEAQRWQEHTLPKEGKLVDWAETVTKHNPKAIIFAGGATEFETLRKSFGKSPMLVYAGDDGSWPMGDAGQTLIVVTTFALGKEPTKAHEFTKKYREQFREDADVHAALAYDNVRLVVETMKKAPTFTPEKMREELLKTQDFAGLTGPMSFGSDQHLKRPVFVGRLDGPARVPVALKSYNP